MAEGFLVSGGVYAAIPFGKSQLMILHNGQQIKVCRNQQSARSFIQKEMKSK